MQDDLMEKESAVARDYGTNCNDCERYKKLGDVCLIEHGKKFLWEYCRDFVPQVVLPEYNELMRTVKQEQAIERQKVREKKERERKKKQKERLEKKEQKRKERRNRLRRVREKKRREDLKRQERVAKKKGEKSAVKKRTPQTGRSEIPTEDSSRIE